MKTRKFRLVEHNGIHQKRWGSNDNTKEHLEVGTVYDAVVEVHSWHTKLLIGGHKFNSVCFEEVHDGTEKR